VLQSLRNYEHFLRSINTCYCVLLIVKPCSAWSCAKIPNLAGHISKTKTVIISKTTSMSTLYTQKQRQVGLLSQPSSLCGHLGITPLCMTCSDKMLVCLFPAAVWITTPLLLHPQWKASISQIKICLPFKIQLCCLLFCFDCYLPRWSGAWIPSELRFLLTTPSSSLCLSLKMSHTTVVLVFDKGSAQ
jgi:hypothetical protein